jgi:hypothetical protein
MHGITLGLNIQLPTMLNQLFVSLTKKNDFIYFLVKKISKKLTLKHRLRQQ